MKVRKNKTIVCWPSPIKKQRALAVYRQGTIMRKAVIASLSPELLDKYWAVKSQGEHRTHGHCYCAAEALWHLLGGRRSTYSTYVIRLHPDVPTNKETHWFLKCRITGKRLDPTSAQFQGERIPYERGRHCGFMTTKPSKRAQIIIGRVKRRLRSK